MDPVVSGFALGLLPGRRQIGVIGTIVCGIGWWRTHRTLRRLDAALPEPAVARSGSPISSGWLDYSASQMERLMRSRTRSRQLPRPPAKAILPEPR